MDYIPIKLDNIFFFNNNLRIDLKSFNKPLFNNLFYYSNKKKYFCFQNYELKESKKKKIIKFSNFQTIIEKQNKRLSYEIYNKKPISNLCNFRIFQYKIYNKFFLLKYFLNNQINNFNYNKKDVYNTFNLLLEKNNIFLKDIKIKKEPNWRNLIRKDLKNFGNTKNEKFLNLDKFKNQSLNLIDFQDKNLNLLNLQNKNDKKNLFFF